MKESKKQIYRMGRAWCIQHPVMDGTACGVVVFIALSLLIWGGVFPAWAVSIPITERMVIDLGSLQAWVATIIAFAVYWEAHKAKQHAAEAVALGAANATKLDIVKKQTDGVLEKVAAMSKKEGKAEEQKEEVAKVAAAKDVMSADAVRDAETKASIAAIEAGQPPNKNKS